MLDRVVSSSGIELKRIPARIDREPLHPTNTADEDCPQIEHDFFIATTPVTRRQYAELIGHDPSAFTDASDDCPVHSVNWEDARTFCSRLTERDKAAGVLPADYQYRLPTETQWECAARSHGDDWFASLPETAWFCVNSEQQPQPVAQKTANPAGLHDLLGNVWEWCLDWFHEGHQKRSVRGGSYYNTPRLCRPDAREGFLAANRGRYTGFRITASADVPFPRLPPADGKDAGDRSPTIYDALSAGDLSLAQKIVDADPQAIESFDDIPPPIHWCIYNQLTPMLIWLLDHNANIERRDQDYGSTPLYCATVTQNAAAVKVLLARGAESSEAREAAGRGLAGFYEEQGFDRDGYHEVAALLG